MNSSQEHYQNIQKRIKKRNAQEYYITEVRPRNLIKNYSLRMNGYQFAFCLSGSIILKVSGKEIHYSKGSFASFSPYNTLEAYNASEDFMCVLLMFEKSFITETLNNIYFLERFKILRSKGVPHLIFSKENQQIIITQIERIKDSINQNNHLFGRELVRSQIIILLYELENILISKNDTLEYDDTKHIGNEKRLADFKNLLLQHFYKERKVTFYAEALNTSIAQLSKLLKDTTGRTAKEHIDEMLLLQAKHLLSSGKYNITEVASLLYYNNLEEFSRFFKRKTGITPLKFSKGETTTSG